MVLPRIIPCLDVRDGRVVKGQQFQNLKDAGDPAACAAAYAAQGGDELVLLDVSATLETRGTRLDTVRAVRAQIDIPLTVGGGVRSSADAEALLEAGADKVAVNSAAVADPDLLLRLAGRFGRQCVVLSIDARWQPEGPRVLTHSGGQARDLDPADWAAQAAELGAGEILLTSWDRDGTRQGYDLELLARVRARVDLPLIASGGAAGVGHLHEALSAGADAVLAASIFHFDGMDVAEVKRQLAALGQEVR